MYISGTLNIIADALSERFSELDSVYEQSEVVNFIKGEIGSDFALKSDFDSYSTAFVRTVGTTLNKDEFIKTETVAINGMIAEAFDGISGHVRIIKEIRGLIVINKSDIDIFSHFFNKYFQKQNDVLVRIVYAHDLIKYKCYIDGGTWQHQPDKEKKTTQHPKASNNGNNKAGRPGSKAKPPAQYIKTEIPELKTKFIELLKTEFSRSKSREIALMFLALIKMGHLNEPANLKELLLSFTDYFGSAVNYTQFAKDFKLQSNTNILAMEKRIGNIKNKNGIK